MNFIPQNDYEGLLAQAKAMHRIIEAMEKSKSIQGRTVDDLTRQLLICGKDHLESEREANQRLTDQVLKLEQERDQLKVTLEIVTNELESWKATEEDLESIRAIQIGKQAIRDSKGLSLVEHDAQVIRDFCSFALKKYRYDLSGFADEFNQLRQKAQEPQK